MSSTIIPPDALRQEVEEASAGKQTIIRTAKGHASYMNIIPKFSLEDLHPTALGNGVHPAFLVDGIEKAEILIGTYQARIIDGEAVSQPGQIPATNIDFDAARAACLAAGAGFHLMTNWEWAMIALWCIANGHDVRGNTNYGKSHSHPTEFGTCAPGSNVILTGSGPDTWRHDGTPYGIADLVGNVWEWVDGLKLASGRICKPTDNSYALSESEWPEAGVGIDFSNGYPLISDKIKKRAWDSGQFSETATKKGFAAPQALKQALIAPCDELKAPGWFWADNTEDFEALPLRGGSWIDGSLAGLGALSLDFQRSFVLSDFGFRPAFIG